MDRMAKRHRIIFHFSTTVCNPANLSFIILSILSKSSLGAILSE
jgi:hypothetical protein